MRDPYQILGVPRSATEAEIKSAFRKLAKLYHPDRNATDPKARERFAEINNAYEIVGDKTKRGQFDRGEIDAEGKPKAPNFEGFSGGHPFGRGSAEEFSFGFGRPGGAAQGGGHPDDVLADLLRGFSGGRQGKQSVPPGRDIAGEVAVSLEDVARGVSKRVSVSGGRQLDVTIPAFVEEGKVIRLAEQGERSPFGGKAGDLLLTVRYLPHPRFTVEGADLKARVPVPLEDAVLGGTIRVPTLTGEAEMSIPAQTSGGRTFRLRGQGMKAGGRRGDLLVSVDIQLPDGDEDLARLMQARRSR